MRQPDADPLALRALVDRVFGRSVPIEITRTPDGVSTPVYRLRRGAENFYLRLAETSAASLAPEAQAHDLLRRRGVNIAVVVHFEPFDEALDRSVMIMTAIPGAPVSQVADRDTALRVMVAAGGDLASINDVPVEGFGWIERGPTTGDRLTAGLPSWDLFALNDLASNLSHLRQILRKDERRMILNLAFEPLLKAQEPASSLAHGDFDTTHIFHDGGEYTGIIDFGEIRGADRFYDLGHFALHDGQQSPYLLLPDLFAGYAAAHTLPPDAMRSIARWAVLIGVQRLVRARDRNATPYRDFLVAAIRRQLVTATN